MPDDAIHKIFKDSMEPDTFSEILTILSTEFIKRKKPLYRYLVDLAQVKRFGALIMFMSTADKKGEDLWGQKENETPSLLYSFIRLHFQR